MGVAKPSVSSSKPQRPDPQIVYDHTEPIDEDGWAIDMPDVVSVAFGPFGGPEDHLIVQQIEFWLRRTGNPPTPAEFRISIWEDQDGEPGNQLCRGPATPCYEVPATGEFVPYRMNVQGGEIEGDQMFWIGVEINQSWGDGSLFFGGTDVDDDGTDVTGEDPDTGEWSAPDPTLFQPSFVLYGKSPF